MESRYAAEPYIRLLFEKNTQESKNEALQLAVKFGRPYITPFYSLIEIGRILYNGIDGYEINKKLTVECYKRLTFIRKDTLAIYLYATMLKNGVGVQKDEITANYLFEKADGENSYSDMIKKELLNTSRNLLF